MKKIIPTFFLTALLAIPATADNLARWNSAAAQPSAAQFPPTAYATDALSVHPLTRGQGIAPYTAPKETFSAYGYNQTSFTAALNGNDYWETALVPADNYALSLTTLVYTFRATPTGPDDWQWTYSLDGTSFTPVGDPVHCGDDNSYLERTVSLAAVPALQNITQPVWFRLYAWNGKTQKTATGVFGKGDKDVLIFQGAAASLAVPPTIVFSGNPSIPLSNTLSIALSTIPTNSTISSCSLTPTPQGPHAWDPASSSFSFTPQESDENQTFTLRAVATNPYGTTTSNFPIHVTAYLPPGACFIDFENTDKTSYARSEVQLGGKTWILDNILIGTHPNDHKHDSRAGRFATTPATMTSAQPLLPSGIGDISFLYATYDNEDPSGATLLLEVSADTSTWIPIAQLDTTGIYALSPTNFTVGASTPLYLRFRTTNVIARVNIDDILISPYAPPPPSSYEAFLLRYNITPGDSFTLPSDDYDGDGSSNQDEQNANTNPYDPDSHP